jgi:hypothetical protein
MHSRLRPSPAMVIALIALFVSLGGTAAALSGSNTVFSDDIANDTFNSPTQGQGGLVAADLRPNSVGTSEVANNAVLSGDIKNGEVSVLDTRKTIPSGATVTGLLGVFENTGPDSADTIIREFVDFHGLLAPLHVDDDDVGFDDIGISAAAAEDGEENPGCAGGIVSPTAPPGKVCIYLSYELVNDGSTHGFAFGTGTSFSTLNRYGFQVAAARSGGNAHLRGTWAYQAP